MVINQEKESLKDFLKNQFKKEYSIEDRKKFINDVKCSIWDLEIKEQLKSLEIIINKLEKIHNDE